MLLYLLPFIDVLTEVGLATAYPQLKHIYNSPLQASSLIAVGPLAAVTTGWCWGPFVRRYGVKTGMVTALLIWSAALGGMSVLLAQYPAALLLRLLHGFGGAGMAAVPFIAAATRSTHTATQSRRMGRIELSASLGAISGPLVFGSAMVLSPRLALTGVAGTGMALFGTILLAVPRSQPPSREKPAKPATAVPVLQHMAPAILYAIIAACLLSALETLIPTAAESATDSALAGKIAAALFEAIVLAGILYQSRQIHPDTRAGGLLAIAFSCLLLSVVLPGEAWLPMVLLLILSGLWVGRMVAGGNQFAARRAQNAAARGMGLYSTIRISGSIIGPMLMNLPTAGLFATLAILCVIADITRTGIRQRRHCPEARQSRDLRDR
ncbi:MFS transporter [Spirochaeta africana]|uniref:Major Facilitator Superfamily transporter n=1 Tax=Spirochaeta africana (strain ATCC 700263 / DSM 8902 / Z-7692) TaxID=889378 RepID=H9UHW9_SPIAZ|nr:MFS transporter [Spirochaeta africana]AFG37112.1 Major Facilitator Superfamily transporter [Spirochaeta africana DSM 8902]